MALPPADFCLGGAWAIRVRLKFSFVLQLLFNEARPTHRLHPLFRDWGKCILPVPGVYFQKKLWVLKTHSLVVLLCD
jgi:hypothetical protein